MQLFSLISSSPQETEENVAPRLGTVGQAQPSTWQQWGQLPWKGLTLSSMEGFWTDILGGSLEGGGPIFLFFQSDIRNKMVFKVKNFQVWVVLRYFE